MPIIPYWWMISSETMAYLSLLTLTLVILGILARTQRKTKTTWLLIAFWASIVVFFLAGMMIFLTGLRAWYVIQYPFLLALTFLLIQFAYHFPQRFPKHAGEQRLVFWLSGSIVAFEISLCAACFFIRQSAALFEWVVLFGRIFPGLGILWGVLMFWRQYRRLKPDAEKEAQACRAFMGVFLILVTLAVWAVLERLVLTIPGATYHFILHSGFLFFLFLFAMAYLNYMPEHHTFMSKLMLSTLVTILATIQVLGQFTIDAYEGEYDAARQADVREIEARLFPENASGALCHAFPASNQKPQLAFIISQPSETAQRKRSADYIADVVCDADFDLRFLREKGDCPRNICQIGYRNTSIYAIYNFDRDRRSYTVGFQIPPYPAYLNVRTLPVIAILCGGTLIILLIFPLFFRESLVKPLARLQEGIRQVNHGNLNSLVPVRYHDEIGFLTHSFNIMTSSVKHAKQQLEQLNIAYERFVPHEFLRFLEKSSIVEVKLGDQVQREMTILFSDIRDFTTLSETMTPQENFNFINSYLRQMEPVIIEHHGFIDKYIGDAIMALFAEGADDAVQAGIAMQRQLVAYNDGRQHAGYQPIRIGVGINTGSLMLGTIGGQHRMEGTVISDAVNVASRIEGLTKKYGAGLLISDSAYLRLADRNRYRIRIVDRVRVKGKTEPMTVLEVFDGDSEQIIELKLATAEDFENGRYLYFQKEFADAGEFFSRVLRVNPADKVAQVYSERCRHFQQYGVPKEWEGIERL